MFGYTHLYGGYAGGQAEYVRVPKANVGPLKLPDGLDDEQVLFLSDILPTGYMAAVNAGIGKGSTLESALTAVKLEGSSGAALRQAIAATRRGGIVSVPGVYAGWIHAFLFGDAFEKGLTLKGGQTHAQAFMPELLEHIAKGDLEPDAIVTHRLPLAEAARGYEVFEKKQEDCRKVILLPQ
jgi:threonine dehydrogenase-like Zn-dependent dehydrogenase